MFPSPERFSEVTICSDEKPKESIYVGESHIQKMGNKCHLQYIEFLFIVYAVIHFISSCYVRIQKVPSQRNSVEQVDTSASRSLCIRLVENF